MINSVLFLASLAFIPQLAQLPIDFEENRGQVSDSSRFLVRAAGYRARLDATGVTLLLPSEPGFFHPVRMEFVGARSEVRVDGESETVARSHYLRGNDPEKWIRDARHFERVSYRELYPGIDVVFHGSGGHIRYDVCLAPGAEATLVRMRFHGVQQIVVDPTGELRLMTPAGDLVQQDLRVYAERDGVRELVDARFVSCGSEEVGFELGPVPTGSAVVIDPTFVFSTYLGGSSLDAIRDLALDGAGNVYVTGMTASVDFPTVNAFQGAIRGFYDVFITKFDATGSSLLYSTYLGGTADFNHRETGVSIGVDANGFACVTGRTDAADFPTLNAAQPIHGGNFDAFVTRLDPTGSSLVYSTYWGGSGNENGADSDFIEAEAGALLVSATGECTVTGATNSANFPTVLPTQSLLAGGHDAFVAVFDASGVPQFSTYLGGSSNDSGHGIARVPVGDFVVAGFALSQDFPTTPGVFSRRAGGGFLTRFRADRSGYVWSTKFDGAPTAVATDSSSRVYATGTTSNFCFPTTYGAHQTEHGNCFDSHCQQVFVTRFTADAKALDYSTYFGNSSANENGEDIAVTAFDEAVVAGVSSEHIGTTSSDALVFKLNARGSDVAWAVTYGGRFTSASCVAIDGASGDIVVGGTTSSDSFPVTNGAFQQQRNGNNDGFVSRLNDVASSVRSVTFELHKVIHQTFTTGIVTLDGSAPAGGALVNLATDDPSIATVPPSVFVPAGDATATFPIDTLSVADAETVQVIASWNGSQAAAELIVWRGPSFGIEFLGTLAGMESEADGINEKRIIVGTSRGDDLFEHVFRTRADGSLEDLGPGFGRDLNELGQVAATSGLTGHAARYTNGIGWQDLGTFPGGSQSDGFGINASAQVVGWSDGQNIQSHAFRYTDGQGMVDLGTLGGDLSFAHEINDAGQVSGEAFVTGNTAWRAFRYTDGVGMENLGVLTGDSNSNGYGINDLGQVCGTSADSGYSRTRAFRYTDGVGMEDLGTLPTDERALGYAINNSGTVVGFSADASFNKRAMRFTDARGMEDLRELLDPREAFRWKTLEEALDINDDGFIVGHGFSRLNACQESAFLLVPCGAHWLNYGTGWPGTLGVPAFTAVNDPRICEPLTVDLENSFGQSTIGLLLLGLNRADIPLRSGATLLVLPNWVFLVSLPAGGVSLQDELPCDPALCGLEIYLQAIEADSGAVGGRSFTQGLKLVIGT